MHSRAVLCMTGHYNFYYVCMYVCTERHDCILQFCCELPRIVKALSIVANWRERASVWTLVLVVIYQSGALDLVTHSIYLSVNHLLYNVCKMLKALCLFLKP